MGIVIIAFALWVVGTAIPTYYERSREMRAVYVRNSARLCAAIMTVVAVAFFADGRLAEIGDRARYSFDSAFIASVCNNPCIGDMERGEATRIALKWNKDIAKNEVYSSSFFLRGLIPKYNFAPFDITRISTHINTDK